MSRSFSLDRGVAAAALTLGLCAGAAQAGPCSAYAGKQFVFLIQGAVRSTDGLSDVHQSVLGRLTFDATGSAGRFSSLSNGGDPVAALAESGTARCIAQPELGHMAQSWTLSNGLELLAMRERGAVQLLAKGGRRALLGEARPAASWAELAGGACDLLPGHRYSGRYGDSADGLGAAGLARWDLSSLLATLQTWGSSTAAVSAQPLSRPLGPCAAAADGAAQLAVNNGTDGTLLAYPAADGSVAWMHTHPGRGVGGWLLPR